MSDKPATIEIMLPEHEQEILDTALLESDQLLARSLHDDAHRLRRRVWILVLVFGEVDRSALLIAFLRGWLTLGQLETVDAARLPLLRQIKPPHSRSVDNLPGLAPD